MLVPALLVCLYVDPTSWSIFAFAAVAAALAYDEFLRMAETQSVSLRSDVCADLSDEQHDQLYEASIVHEKPLINALGDGFKSVLTKDRVRRLFESM